ncbi:MAG: hypothetical protein JXB48_20410 [Candidatus Latescibacteria bacterium]|nr:hypothetical protein [Candidatus Latescibacterota bacterium]
MIIDERIKSVRNRTAAGGFFIMSSLLLIDLLYRQFYLKQTPGNYWDILLIWFASVLYVGITAYSSGMMSGKISRQFKVIIPTVIVAQFATLYFRGRITSMHDLSEFILSLVVMIPVLFSVFLFYYYLNRRWEKKNELDE